MQAHDDFDDPQTSARLRRWAAGLQRDGVAPQGAAPDLGALHRALDRVDAETGAGRWRRWPAAAALLAAALLLVLLWPQQALLPVLPGTPPQLLDLVLSPQRDLVRGQEPPPPVAGGELYAHCYAAAGGFAVAVLLQPPATARLLTQEAVALGDEPLGPFPTGDGHGLRGLLLVASSARPDRGQVERIAAAAAAALSAQPIGSADAMRAAIAAAFAGARGLAATCVPFTLP